jgi:glycine cleavage system transcriptional repressor
MSSNYARHRDLKKSNSMPKEYIITMTAGNRTGILSAVTKAMEELGADLREASQTVVRGYFTMIFSIEFPDRIEESVIRDHLQDACRPFDIEISLRDPSVHLSAYNAAKAETKPYRLRLGGRNEQGALRKVSQVMSLHGIDITGMHALRTAEGTGFEMVMRLAMPSTCTVESFLNELTEAGRAFEMTADISEFIE